MTTHTERLSLTISADDARAACLRGLRLSGFQQIPCGGVVVELPESGSVDFGDVVFLIPPIRRFYERARTVTLGAISRPGGSEGDICAVHGSLGTEGGLLVIALRTVKVRISVREVGATATELTITCAATLPWKVRSTFRLLLQSIKIQAEPSPFHTWTP